MALWIKSVFLFGNAAVYAWLAGFVAAAELMNGSVDLVYDKRSPGDGDGRRLLIYGNFSRDRNQA